MSLFPSIFFRSLPIYGNASLVPYSMKYNSLSTFCKRNIKNLPYFPSTSRKTCVNCIQDINKKQLLRPPTRGRRIVILMPMQTKLRQELGDNKEKSDKSIFYLTAVMLSLPIAHLFSLKLQ